jgi:hypothetical protein
LARNKALEFEETTMESIRTVTHRFIGRADEVSD